MDASRALAATRPRTLRSAVSSVRLTGVLLALTVGVALALRLYGLGWDEGYSYTPHPDERAILANVGDLALPSPGNVGQLLSAEESPWNPRWFPYGSLPLYLLRLVEYGSQLWPAGDLHDLRLAGRALSALADVAAVVVLFLLGSRLYGRRVGLLASGMAALAVIHIQLSHFYAVDTLLALFALLALYFMYQVAARGKTRDSVLAGVFIGLGLATKASLLPIFIAYGMAHVMLISGAINDEKPPSERLRGALKGGVAGLAAALGVLIVVQPYMFVDWSRFYADFAEQSEMVRRIRDYPYTRQYIDTTPYWYHVRHLATWGLGWPLGLVAWSGLIFAAVRGTRIPFALAYLTMGLVAPAALLLYSTSMWALVLASGLAFAALLAFLPLRSRETRADLLLLAWVVPYLLITGALEVKFLRYMLPVTPVLILFGSRMFFTLWDRTAPSTRARAAVAAGAAFVVGATAFYAVAYTGIYSEPHTAVRMSAWINANVPPGAAVLKEHWEEGLPGMHEYRIPELPLYEEDTPHKLDQLTGMLAEADYLAFFSNRLYGTIPRLPERYPATSEYYRELFSGGLGYELVRVEATYPALAGVAFAHDTFGRPGLPEPAGYAASQGSGGLLNLGFADESFTVYDHPTVLLFKNEARQDAATLRRALESTPVRLVGDPGESGTAVGLLYTPEEAAAQRAGGTWSEIVRPDSWPSKLPVLAWLVVVEGLAMLAWPIAFVLFRPLADRGYQFAKMIGLLAVGLIAWLLASFEIAAFSAGSVSIAAAALAAVSAATMIGRRREMMTFVRARWRLLAVAEVVFLLAFLGFLIIRMANPDLWHPHLGGEKPMDLAYLTAVLRSSFMPPYDPWFAGGYLNYYYWGQFLTATLIHATGIAPAVAYNLAVPLFFALTAGGAFAVVYNLAAASRRKVTGASWSPVGAGVVGAVFVTVLGNLDGAVQVGQGIWRAAVQHAPFGTFDFWRSSRMMPPGNEITEFPFFTFLFGDLHAHMMALPFTLLTLGIALTIVLAALPGANGGRAARPWSGGSLARLAALGLVVGSLRLINTWDYPTYMLIGAAAIFLAAFYRNGGLNLAVLVETGTKAGLVFLVGWAVFLPYHLEYEAFFVGIQSTTNTTVLWRFLGITGLFTFVIGSFFLVEGRSIVSSSWLGLRRSSHTDAVSLGDPRVAAGRAAALAATALIAGLLLFAGVSAVIGSTIPFAAAFVALVLIVGLGYLASTRPDAPVLAFVAVLVGVSLLLVIGLDIYRVDGDIDRMNSVFKFYLQVWVLLALSAAYLLWRMWDRKRTPLPSLSGGKKLWVAAAAVLVVSASVYPLLGTGARLDVRFQSGPPTLDGTAYMANAVYRDPQGAIELDADRAAILWIQKNVQGSPVILEGHALEYRWGNRVSIYTGLPSVVGWKWHQEQQRFGYRAAVDERVRDVERIYSTPDAAEALALLRAYNVELVYVGQMERLYYPSSGLAKFEGELSPAVEAVYKTEDVTLYRLRDEPQS